MKRPNLKDVLTVFTLLLTCLVVLFYTTKGKLIKISKENIWAIGIFKGKDPLHIAPDEMINNPVIDASAVNDVHAAFVADPFLWRKDSLWYLFFEVLNKKDMKGDIGYAFSSDCRKWQYGKIVVDCLYHISYPYIFSWNDSIFMIPESAEAGFLSIYYAKEFPERWEIVDTILYGAYGDHGVIRYDNLWWIFACSEPVKNNELKLYYSDCLYGNWIEHPSSPIVQNDDSKARPGGRMLFLNNQIIRFAQNCNKTYGIEVNAFTITKMDKERYAETKSGTNPVVKRGNNKWALHGMHNVDAFKISDSEYVAAVDGYNKKIVLSIEF